MIAGGEIIYVDADADGANNGTSWENAFVDLQDALGTADSNDQIWVAEGTYKPDADANRSVSFELVEGAEIYGGFDGDEDSLDERDWLENETILSGDLLGDYNDPNCVLLLHLDGAVKIEDDSPSQHEITENGGAQLSTTGKWSGSSLLMDSVEDNLTLSDSDDWDICGDDTSNWTMDTWVNLADTNLASRIVGQWEDSSNYWTFLYLGPGYGFTFVHVVGGSPKIYIISYVTTNSGWHHVGLCKVGDDIGIYLDGDQICYGAVEAGDVGAHDGPLVIGSPEGDPYRYYGHLDEMRIVKGNPFGADPDEGDDEITVPTGEHSADENCVLLLHLNGAVDIEDSSPSQHEVTRLGNAKLVTTGKWNNSSLKLAYIGDKLTFSDSNDWNILENTTDSWTIDLWADLTPSDADEIIGHWQDGSNYWHFFYLGPGMGLGFVQVVGGTARIYILTYQTATTGWHHLALCKVGDDMGIYLDGDQVGYNAIDASDLGTHDGPLIIGASYTSPSTYPYTGYMDELRIIKANPFGANPNSGKTDEIVVPSSEYPWCDNSYHVVTGADDSILDGFIITNGNADGSDTNSCGGGIYNNGSEPVLEHCIISDNRAYNGGGMYNNACSPTVKNSVFSENDANLGGAIYDFNSSVVLTNCTIVDNSADDRGGGMYNYGASSEPNVTNCIFWDDIAVSDGNEIYNASGASPNFSYCDIEDSGGSGGGWDSDIGADGSGNIDADPCFIDASSNDLHIKINSPCINVGDPCFVPDTNETDIDSEPRVLWDRVDMGVDEVSYLTSQWKLDECSGTIAYDSVDDHDGIFNGDDPNWVSVGSGCAVDFNGGNDYFSVSSLDNGYSSSDVFTVAGWFNTEQSTGMQTIVGQWMQFWGAGQEYLGWQVLVENDKVVARFGQGIPTPGVTGTTDVSDGYWHHFAMVRNGTSTVLYVDGQPEDSDTVIFYVYNTKFRIGDGSYVFSGSPALKGGPFNGMIDDVMIFDRALSADEVEDLYESGL